MSSAEPRAEEAGVAKVRLGGRVEAAMAARARLDDAAWPPELRLLSAAVAASTVRVTLASDAVPTSSE